MPITKFMKEFLKKRSKGNKKPSRPKKNHPYRTGITVMKRVIRRKLAVPADLGIVKKTRLYKPKKHLISATKRGKRASHHD